MPSSALRSDSPVNTLNITRRLIVIPALFLLLIVFTLGYTLQALQAYKDEAGALEMVARQRALRARYTRDVLLASEGVRTPYTAKLQEVDGILGALMQGGAYRSDVQEGVIHVPKPTPEIARELVQKRRLLVDLDQETARLFTLPHTISPAFKQSMERIAAISRELDDPRHDLLKAYIHEAERKIHRMIWLETLLVLLVGGLGIALTLQQRKADRVLLESEDRFRQIFDAAPIGKVLVDMEGRSFKVNPALCSLLGYSRAELLGKRFEEMTLPEEFEAESQLRKRLIAGEIKTYQVTKRYRHKDGHLLWVMATVAAVRSPEGQPQYLVVQVMDITEQKRTMQALQTSETRYRSVVDTATDGIIVSNSAGQIQSANSEACRMFGYAQEELIGKPLVSLVSASFVSDYERSMRRLVGGGTEHPAGGQMFELSGRHKRGDEFPMEISLSSWRDPQDGMAHTCIIRDLTERRRSEKERQELIRSNRDLEEFAIIASHDLQEPLRKIVFYTERFATREGERLAEESQQNVEKILSSTQRMQNLITDLLAYSRISARQGRFSPVDLQHVVQEAIHDMERPIHETEAIIEVTSLPIVEADSTQMRQLFANLLENALKYRRDGVSPHIRIYGKVINAKTEIGDGQPGQLQDNPPGLTAPSLSEEDISPGEAGQQDAGTEDGRTLVRVYVEDNGIGFDEKYLDRIFKVFQRLHGRGQYSGTGIGLATCRRIAERHKGNITATSTPGVGSTFMITLPVHQKGTTMEPDPMPEAELETAGSAHEY